MIRLSSFRKYFLIILNKNKREIELTKIAASITFTPKKFKIDKIKNHRKSVAPSTFSEFKLKTISPLKVKFSTYLNNIKASS